MPGRKRNRRDRLSVNAGLASIVAAVVLFAIASLFEDDSRWQPAQVEIPAMNPERDSGIRGPLRTMSAAENCDTAETALRGSVEQSRLCESDDDCTIFDYGYPIQCLTSVAKSEITALRLEYRKYQASCDFRVYYDCPSGDVERRAVCRSKRCEVELVTLDGLKEETLDHIGVLPQAGLQPRPGL